MTTMLTTQPPGRRTVSESSFLTGLSEMALRGLDLPSIHSGQGRTALLPEREVFAAYVAVRLKRAGLTNAAIARGVRLLSSVDLCQSLARGERWLVVGPDSARLVAQEGIAQTTGAKPGIVLDLGPVFDRFREAVAQLEERNADAR